jgi:hypothetical protein
MMHGLNGHKDARSRGPSHTLSEAQLQPR